MFNANCAMIGVAAEIEAEIEASGVYHSIEQHRKATQSHISIHISHLFSAPYGDEVVLDALTKGKGLNTP